jgi:hypothetical protein
VTLTKEQKREIAHRLENWALWCNSGGVGPRKILGAPFPAYNLVNIAGSGDDRNNLIVIGDAEDTDRILRSMHLDHVKALIVHYVWSATLTPKARARACKVRVWTYYRRVARAEEIFNRLCFPRQREESITQFASNT